MKITISAAALRDPADSAEIAVVTEEAAYCDGSECSSGMPNENGELELLSPHWHMVERGRSPEAGPRCYPIW